MLGIERYEIPKNNFTETMKSWNSEGNSFYYCSMKIGADLRKGSRFLLGITSLSISRDSWYRNLNDLRNSGLATSVLEWFRSLDDVGIGRSLLLSVITLILSESNRGSGLIQINLEFKYCGSARVDIRFIEDGH